MTFISLACWNLAGMTNAAILERRLIAMARGSGDIVKGEWWDKTC
jgi:hypothetical protein